MGKVGGERDQREGSRGAAGRRSVGGGVVALAAAMSAMSATRAARRARPAGGAAPVAPHGAVLRLPLRDLWSGPALDPAGPAAPPMDGSLALLDAPSPAPDARRHILIVEDDARTAGLVRAALELEGDPGWGIEVAVEGLQALDLAVRTPPDLVLLDVRLPGLDGGEVYRRLRARLRDCAPRVLFLTAGTALDLHEHGIDDGVLLRKPFEVPELVALVRALLRD
jgi:CheY-like chemotaxis protein